MKTLVLGDVHGRKCWEDIIERENFDKIVFLGDYVSSHEDIHGWQQIDNLIKILEYKEKNSDTVVLLRGNHDIQHLTGDTYVSEYDREVGEWMYDNRKRFLDDTQWIYIDDGTYPDVIFSHAGISKKWMEDCNYESFDEINESTILQDFGFRPCKLSDYDGSSATQPPTWIRPWTLDSYAVPGKTWIVGHTQFKPGIIDLYDYARKEFPNDPTMWYRNHIWCCDALGIGQYLVIEPENHFIVKSLGDTL